MSKDAVKPVVRKRPKRDRDNNEFDVFTRRILQAYGRRVAAGDVEFLQSMVSLGAELDAVIAQAVGGLRQVPYTWAEIGSRLGVSRQAAQMRYGARHERESLDQRLIDAGLSVTVAMLVTIFAEHHPGVPAASTCPGCGYTYPEGVTDCPTNATVRPLLYRRRAEDRPALDRLSGNQLVDLNSQKVARTNRVAAVQATRPAARPHHTASQLFSLNGKDCQP